MVAYLSSEFGTVTSTFVYREIEALRRLGLDVRSFSTTRPREALQSQEAGPLVRETQYLYDESKLAILAAAFSCAALHPHSYLRGLMAALHDACFSHVTRLSDRIKLLWHFMVGCSFSRTLRRHGIEHLHAHFAHVPTSVAMYASLLADIPFSFTNHANDIFERPVALREKVARSAFTACENDYNRRFLRELGCDDDKMHIVRCSLDLDQFIWSAPRVSGTPMILSVGRFVEKKGFVVLVDALAALRDERMDFRCRIVGEGPLFESIRERIRERALEDRIELLGSQPQERVRVLFTESDIFALPCVVARSGDRDGIPNVFMEAMASGVPVIGTRVSGIPELIEDGRTGLLAEPDDVSDFARALKRLMMNRELGTTMSKAARERVATEFESMHNAKIMHRLIQEAVKKRVP